VLVQSFLELGGKKWRLTKLPAWFAKSDEPEIMASVAVLCGKEWIQLDSPELIDEHVPDWEALSFLEQAAMKYNYAFLETWRPIRTPASMAAKYVVVECRNVDTIFSALIAAQYATLHELRTIYSLEDVFMMIEVLTVSSINEHNAIHAK
jgi:hypothetical protein